MSSSKNGINRRTMLGASAVAGVAALVTPQLAWAAPERVPTAESGRRADLAEQAILKRHLRPLWGLPGTELALEGWPANAPELAFIGWTYWFQAQLLDCAIDAADRGATPQRRARISAITRGIRACNVTGWTNRYYDDMAWLALALERADRTQGITCPDGINDLRGALSGGWNAGIGAVPWRVGSDYFNAPANGPTGIAFARFGELSRAERIADFLHTRLRDKRTGLIFDGIHEPGGRLERPIYSYCQGVALGLETELALRTGSVEHHKRAAALVSATAAGVTKNGVITSAGGGNGGLFGGILARYLALAALKLPESGTRAAAARVVHASARAAWENRAEVDGLPLFGADWAARATVPGPGDMPSPLQIPDGGAEGGGNPARGISVQLGGWMLLEADYRLTAAGL